MHYSKSFTDVVTRKHIKVSKGAKIRSRYNQVPYPTQESFKCDRGLFFQVANLNGNLTQFRPSRIHYLRDPTARNGSLDMGQPEM